MTATARSIPAPTLTRSVSKNTLFKAAAVALRAHVANITAEAAATALYGRDHNRDLISRAASTAATTGNAAWAGVWAHAQVVSDLLQAIVSISAGASLLGRAQQISFDNRQSIRIPQRLVDPNFAGTWTGEGAAVPVYAYSISSGVILTPHKLNVSTVFTREILESSNIEAFVRSMLSESAALAIDKALFGTQADDGVTPAGILNGIGALTAAAATTGRWDAMAADIENMIAALATAGGGANPVFIAAPGQAAAMAIYAGPRFGDAIFASTVIPARTVICIEPRSLIATIDAVVPEFEVANATLLHLSTTPTDLGTPSKSLYQTDMIALKLVLRNVDWKLRAPHVAWVSATNW